MKNFKDVSTIIEEEIGKKKEEKIRCYLTERKIFGEDVEVGDISIIDVNTNKKVRVSCSGINSETGDYFQFVRKLPYNQLMKDMKKSEEEFLSTYNCTSVYAMDFITTFVFGIMRNGFDNDSRKDFVNYLTKAKCVSYNGFCDLFSEKKLCELEEFISLIKNLATKYNVTLTSLGPDTKEICLREIFDKETIEPKDKNILSSAKEALTKQVAELVTDSKNMTVDDKLKVAYYDYCLEKIADSNLKFTVGVMGNIVNKMFSEKEGQQINIGNIVEYISKNKTIAEIINQPTDSIESLNEIETMSKDLLEKQLDDISEYLGNILNPEREKINTKNSTVLGALEMSVNHLKETLNEVGPRREEALNIIDRIAHNVKNIKNNNELLKISEDLRDTELGSSDLEFSDYVKMMRAYIKLKDREFGDASSSVVSRMLKLYVQRQADCFEEMLPEELLESIPEYKVEIPKKYFKGRR